MKFTLSWLKQHLDTSATLDEICDKLTAIGLEVEGVADRGAALKPFTVAQVIAAEKHPQADRLKVCVVDTGAARIQVVCGAPNARAGLKTVLAQPGDIMPDSGEALKKGVIRGVESQGMLCAADELCLGEESAGILELPADAPVGANYAAYAGLNDPVIEINLTPNRGDCAGVRGIARDLAAAGLGTLKPLAEPVVKSSFVAPIKLRLDFAEPSPCPLFTGILLRNIKNRPSPEWLQRQLRAIGLRPISALVDITNYLTFDQARPLHVFDAAKIKGDLWVRSAKGGESFAALNGKSYTAEAGMTLIGDDSGALSLAGIMGGATTSCDADTTAVFIESALFDPARTARTGRALQLTSDARYRFERGVDPASTLPGLLTAAQLVMEFCGDAMTEISEVVVAGAVPNTAQVIAYDPQKCLKLIGVDVPVAEQTRILTALGFGVEGAAMLSVRVPSWRPDIEGAADLAEEIIRIKGFAHIPATSLPRPDSVTLAALDRTGRQANAALRALAAQGLMEAVTWSFMPSGIAAQFGAVDDALRLVNPISADLDVMRPNILGNLIMAAKRNADRGFADVGLFEVGPVYRDATPEGQSLVACALRSGATPRHWATPSRPVDAFDAKADALAALTAAGAPVASLQTVAEAPAWYHPGRSGSLKLGPAVLAVFGELHPALLAACGAEGPMVGCEIFVAAIPQPRSGGTAKPLLKLETLQAVTRDFAFVVDRAVAADKLVKAARGADKTLIRDVTVFDVYEGERMGADKKSIALSVTLQPAERSLTDAEIESLATRITAAVAKATGATLRG